MTPKAQITKPKLNKWNYIKLKSKRENLKNKKATYRLGEILQIIYLRGAAAKSLQSCPTLCDPIDSSPPGSTVPGIPQARTLE